MVNYAHTDQVEFFFSSITIFMCRLLCNMLLKENIIPISWDMVRHYVTSLGALDIRHIYACWMIASHGTSHMAIEIGARTVFRTSWSKELRIDLTVLAGKQRDSVQNIRYQNLLFDEIPAEVSMSVSTSVSTGMSAIANMSGVDKLGRDLKNEWHQQQMRLLMTLLKAEIYVDNILWSFILFSHSHLNPDHSENSPIDTKVDRIVHHGNHQERCPGRYKLRLPVRAGQVLPRPFMPPTNNHHRTQSANYSSRSSFWEEYSLINGSQVPVRLRVPTGTVVMV